MAERILDPFFNVEYRPLPVNDDVLFPKNIREIQSGFGSKAFKVDSQGIWLGANKYADAPFRISMDGVIFVKSTSGGHILIDGPNQRIVVNDGTDDRVLIGNLE